MGAVYYNGQTFFGYVDNSGVIKARSFDHSTLSVSSAFNLHATGVEDHHADPWFLVRDSDKRLVVAYCGHNDSHLYVRISTNPEDATAWGSEADIDASVGGSLYTYPNLFQLLGEASDPIYLFCRDTPSGSMTLMMTKSTDGGSTWSAKTKLWQGSGVGSYWRIYSNDNDRLDFIVSDGTDLGDDASAYHFYYQGGSYHKTNGTAMGSPPFGPADATKVYDGTGAGVRLPYGIVVTGGEIIALLATWNGTGTLIDYRYTRYAAGTWTTHLMGSAGAEADFLEGGLALDPADPRNVYMGQYDGSEWHMFKWRTEDHGATWPSKNRLTYSGGPHWDPIIPKNYAGELRVLWLEGPFALGSPYDYDLGINGSRL